MILGLKLETPDAFLPQKVQSLIWYNETMTDEADRLKALLEEKTRALDEYEIRYRVLVEDQTELTCRFSIAGQLAFANAVFKRYFTVEEGDPYASFASQMEPADRAELETRLSMLNQHNPVTRIVLRTRCRTGEMRWFDWTLRAILFDVQGQITEFHAVGRDVTERKRSDEKIRHQMQQLSALRSIDNAILKNFDMQANLETILEYVLSRLDVDAASILLYNRDNQMLVQFASKGFWTPIVQDMTLELGQGLAGRAALERQMVIVENVTDLPESMRQALDLDFEDPFTYIGVPLVTKDRLEGVMEIFTRTVLAADQEWFDFLNALAGQAAIAIENATLFLRLQETNRELSLAYDSTLEGLVRALELRDGETEGHARRVSEMTVNLARFMNVPEAQIVHIRRGALLHDIGKIGVPDHILHKGGDLAGEEWQVMRQHPAFAYQMLSPIDYLRPALDIPYFHHEHWDGSGYPMGLAGEQIPFAARLFAVVDVWDALRSCRPYRDSWSLEKARQYIREKSGIQFDPRIVDAFLKLYGW
ncbi:MAG TPA: HD domain-containing phosphohydrolase [Anaerolineaceae bacterium]|nr:HD domain-containing phosphohydrolase [Anaerolineaceae bacterium]HPN50740.1 HD domain-containing phosphohydrolase [Anaerolineaceae bacterium]